MTPIYKVAAAKIAYKIKSSNPQDTSSLEVLTYGATHSLHVGSIVSICAIAGLLSGRINETMIAVFSFMITKAISGGSHFKSLEACAIVSVILLSLVPFISTVPIPSFVFVFFNTLIALLFCPNITEEISYTNKTKKILKATLLITIVLACIWDMRIVIISQSVVMFTVIPLRGGELK